MIRLAIICAALLGSTLSIVSPLYPQDTARASPTPTRPWYERLRIRGYGQIRYNRLLENNDQLQCEQCDRSWGTNGGVSIRRARLVLQGQIHPRVAIYLQPDFANTVGSSANVVQLRDWYVDLGLSSTNALRLRLGQSKIPYSYENLQSSQNRLPLDRADATNSAHANERDLGAFLMWAPVHIRERFARLVNDGLKGSGDYGVLTIGAFNGQTANRPEANNNAHLVARATWPFAFGTQIVEPSLAAYRGEYVVTAEQRTQGVRGTPDFRYRDERVLMTVAIAPRPLGVLAEYNVGRGPEYDPRTDSIGLRPLRGGFITTTWQVQRDGQLWLPFARYQVYRGGKKHERDARSYSVNDVELGVEWQPSPAVEVTMAWYRGDRRFEDKTRPSNHQRGRLLRLQLQFNY